MQDPDCQCCRRSRYICGKLLIKIDKVAKCDGINLLDDKVITSIHRENDYKYLYSPVKHIKIGIQKEVETTF